MLLAGPRLVFTLPPNNPLHRTRPDGRPGELRRWASWFDAVVFRGAFNVIRKCLLVGL